MTFTGLTPLLDSLKAAGRIKFFWDFRSGSVKDIMLTGIDFSTGTGGIIQRGCMAGNGLLVVPTTANPNMSGTAFSVIARLRPNAYVSAGTKPVIIGDTAGSTATGGWALWITKATGHLTMRVYSNASAKESLGAAGNAVLGRKNTFGASYKDNDANGLQSYVDGVATGAVVSTVGHAVFWRNSALKLFEGVGPVSNNQLVCNLDYILITNNYFLSAAEHATLTDELDNQIRYETQSMIVNSTFPTLGGDVYRACYGILAGETTMSAGQSLGQLDPLKVSTGTHKATTFLYNGVLAKGIQCVTAGDIILPDPRPDLGTTWGYMYYTAATTSWAAVTSATATVTLAAAGDRILWATADGRTCLRKY